MKTALALLDRYLVDGCMTASEPLLCKLVNKDAAVDAPITGEIGYIKGQARVLVLCHLIVHLIDVGRLEELKQVRPCC